MEVVQEVILVTFIMTEMEKVLKIVIYDQISLVF